MKNTLFIVVLLATLQACQDTPSANSATNALAADALPPVVSMTGLLQFGSGRFAFRDCKTNALYMVIDSTERLQLAYRAACQPAPIPAEAVYAEVKGRVSTHTAGPILSIVAVDSMAAKNSRNTCVPYDFWCSGTEPFWSLQISRTEDGIFLKNIADETGKNFNYNAPKVEGKRWEYTGANRDNPAETITVVVEQEPCSDGMSDLRFNYSTTVRIGKTLLRGCALRQNEAGKITE
jgi:uncharacterized membrane protein